MQSASAEASSARVFFREAGCLCGCGEQVFPRLVVVVVLEAVVARAKRERATMVTRIEATGLQTH